MLHDALLMDPALAARILKVVNSAFYRRQREVASPQAAIRLLGVDSIRNIALAASLHRLFRGRRTIPGFDPGDVWSHCVAVGTAARVLAVRTGTVSPEEAMLAGLLHDLGVIVAMQAWLPEFTVVVQRAALPNAPSFLELERQEIGATHEDFGGALCDAWHFPPSFVLACQHHHDFRGLAWHEQRLPALIHLADALAARIGVGYTATVDPTAPLPEALEVLQLTELDVAEVEAQVAKAVPQAVSLLAA
jgi:HD-like signal output (HDOD) protein